MIPIVDTDLYRMFPSGHNLHSRKALPMYESKIDCVNSIPDLNSFTNKQKNIYVKIGSYLQTNYITVIFDFW